MKQRLKSYITALTIFLIPLFFLPITHEFYNTNKVVLLIISSLVLVSISAIQFIKNKKIVWSRHSLMSLLPLLIFLVITSASTLIRSSNIVQSALDTTLGFIMLAALTVFYWYIAQQNDDETKKTHTSLLSLSGLCVSIITIILSFQPFRSLQLPQTFLFLKNPQFTPLGDQKDLAVFLGFILTYQVLLFIGYKKQENKTNWLSLVVGLCSLIAFSVSINTIIASRELLSAPAHLSARAVIHEFSNPVGFFFGAGVDSFGAVFTQIKDSLYQESIYWQVSTFNSASSGILQILVESGMLGGLALVWVVVSGFLRGLKNDSFQKIAITTLLIYISIAFILAPVSFILLFLLYVTLGLFATDSTSKRSSESYSVSKKLQYILMPIITLMMIVSLVAAWYGMIRIYRAEIAMRSSIEAVADNDLEKLYEQQRKAVILNPFIERYRVNFSQTNLFIAKQLAAQAKPNQSLVTKSVQAAINEARAVVSLNPKRASNWENLAVIYKNVLGVKDASQWAIASYQRAIMLDPQNISYRLSLGGVYYSLGQYENAIRMFNEAIIMKPDLTNAYYNLAHAYYQNQNIKKAVEVMDILLSILEKQASPNYEKVLKERDDFKANSPNTEAPSVIQ